MFDSVSFVQNLMYLFCRLPSHVIYKKIKNIETFLSKKLDAYVNLKLNNKQFNLQIYCYYNDVIIEYSNKTATLVLKLP